MISQQFNSCFVRWVGYGVITVLASIGLSAQVQAASTIETRAKVTFTVINAINRTHPNKPSELQIQGWFSPVNTQEAFIETSGDGRLLSDNPAVGPVAVSKSFTHNFLVQGMTSTGTLETVQLGHFELVFDNLGTDTYDVQVRVDYLLESSAQGEDADTSVSIDSFVINGGVPRSNTAGAVSPAQPTTTRTGSEIFAVTVNGGASESVVANVRVVGTVAAQAAQRVPVPMPAYGVLAILLVLTGMRGRRVARTDEA